MGRRLDEWMASESRRQMVEDGLATCVRDTPQWDEWVEYIAAADAMVQARDESDLVPPPVLARYVAARDAIMRRQVFASRDLAEFTAESEAESLKQSGMWGATAGEA